MPFVGAEVKAVFEELKQSISPDLIFTHNRNDAHQDHRLISELTWNTFRDHLILEYEIPKYDGDMGQPNVFVPLEAEIYQKKVRYIMDAFQSQHAKRWFQEDTFLSLMRLRGMECNAPSGYAEAFYCRRPSCSLPNIGISGTFVEGAAFDEPLLIRIWTIRNGARNFTGFDICLFLVSQRRETMRICARNSGSSVPTQRSPEVQDHLAVERCVEILAELKPKFIPPCQVQRINPRNA